MRFLRWLIPGLVLAALVVAQPAGAIVSGSQVPITDHPYQARVVVTAPSGQYACGGVIVGDRRIATAAHCVYIDDTLLAPNKVAVGYGGADRADPGDLTPASVSEVTILKDYLTDGTYDVALLDLATPLPLNGTNVDSIRLASSSALSTGVGSEATAFATGWGNIRWRVDDPDPLLRGVALPLRADSVCEARYTLDYEGSRLLCAGGKELGTNARDTCQGDSGGPLALDSGSGYELVGLTSGGFECGRSFTPAYYTETSSSAIKPVIEGSASPSSTFRGSEWSPQAGGSAPPVTVPPSQAPAPPGPGVVATRDTTRPTAKIAKLSCTRKRRCSFKVSTADVGGTVRKLSATVTRKVRVCKRSGEFRYCSVTDRKKTLKPKQVAGGFTFSATLVKASYKLTAVATDAAGNRSATLKKSFRVR